MRKQQTETNMFEEMGNEFARSPYKQEEKP